MNAQRTIGIGLMIAMSLMGLAGTARAGIPEPDVIYYGEASHKGGSASEEITLVLDANAKQIASYMPGSNTAYGKRYVVKVLMDALASIEGQSASFYIGDTLVGSTRIPSKGSVVNLNLDTLYMRDSDEDGMADSWELTHFGSLSRDGSADLNGNGMSDLDDFRNDNDPTAPDWHQLGELGAATRVACVPHPLVLHNALSQAEADQQHNHINLPAGTYAGSFSYATAAEEDFDLKIVGGYADGCDAPGDGGTPTVLDGDGLGPVLQLDTAGEHTTGAIHIEGLQIKNGAAPAASGGGLQVRSDQGDVTIVGNTVTDSTADQGGGIAVATQSGTVYLANNLVPANSAEQGGGVWISSDSGAITLVNNTIDGNTALQGGGIYCRNTNAALTIANNIVTSSPDGEGIWVAGGNALDIDYNTVWNHAKGNYNRPDLQGAHDLDLAPLFVDATGGQYRLQAASPGLDAGRNTARLPVLDRAGRPRVMDGDGDLVYRVDMGAYEVAGAIPQGCESLSDYDCDGVANDQDQCQGFNDTEDTDKDGLPDGCDRWPGIDDSMDGDEDGMPDGWEETFGLDPAADDDADADADGDRFSNLQEYLAGTAPNDSESAPPNHGPTAPALNYPAAEAEVAARRPTLSVNNAGDRDQQPLTYTFEVYADAALTTLVAAATEVPAGEQTTAWQVDTGLDDNTAYTWRARASDGAAFSAWMTTARFFVNTVKDAPSWPSLSAPADGAEVSTVQPTLEVTNADDVDGDALTYDFEVYADAAMQELVTSRLGLPEGAAGTTAWQVNLELQDSTAYWWRAQAQDEEPVPSGWTPLFTFFVNTANEAPSPPAVVSPSEGEEVAGLTPTLTVANATDGDLDPLTYVFELDTVRTFDSAQLELSAVIAEGAGDTTSWTPVALADNTTYYWRVRASDGAASSAWLNGSFLVNAANDAPGTPTLQQPGDHSEVTTVTPQLAVQPAGDVDGDDLTYDYEIYATGDLLQPLAATTGAGPSWQVEVILLDNTAYQWRARAVDAHGLAGEWSATVMFFVNTLNDPPRAPTVNTPVSGGTVTSLQPTLVVNNAKDVDHDALTYDFELYDDADLAGLVAEATVAEGRLLTAWTVEAELTDLATYYWRARSNDDQGTSSWTPTAVFVVHTSGAETLMEIVARQEVLAAALTTQTIEVTDPDHALYGVGVDIPPEALTADLMFTIGLVSNPPALPANVKAVSKVIFFGPEGTTFLAPVRLMLPYTQEDLERAEVGDPAQLEVYTYNTADLTWQEIPIDHVDTQNQYLISLINHFSQFTIAKTVPLPPSAAGGGSGACFIATAAYGSSMDADVQILRELRDRFLLPHALGRRVVELYYAYSPPTAAFIAKHASMQAVVRWSLLPVVGVSRPALHPGLAALVVVILLGLVLAGTTARVFSRQKRRRMT